MNVFAAVIVNISVTVYDVVARGFIGLKFVEAQNDSWIMMYKASCMYLYCTEIDIHM